MPSVWTAILADPVNPFDPDTLKKVVRDQQSRSRRYLYPLCRLVSRVSVLLIVALKRLVPIRWSAHGTMDRLCVWFLRNFVSADAGELLIRHFVVETNLLNFVIVHSGVPGLRPVNLKPTTLKELGNRAVIEHDVNVYEVLTAIGIARKAGVVEPQDCEGVQLEVPEIDAERDRRRIANLDIQTALGLMNIPFALCLTPAEYRRAVHSLRLDDPLMTLIAEITGDHRFLRWRPAGTPVRVDSTLDVPRAVYEHAVYCEQAHALLKTITPAGTRDQRGEPRPPSAPSAAVPSSPSSWLATA